MFVQLFFLSILYLEAVVSRPLEVRRGHPYSRLVVFGDNYSDAGNGAWIASNMTWPSDPAYYGHRFSNGPVWNEHLAQTLGIPLLSYAAAGATVNNAFVAGFTGYNSTYPVPGVADQITTFLSSNKVEPDDIVVLYAGSNDKFFDLNITSQQTAQALEGQVHRLYDEGAHTILLADYPDLDLLPAAASLPDPLRSDVGSYLQTLRSSLHAVAIGWQPYIDIAVVGVGRVFANVAANPGEFSVSEQYVHPPTACLLGVFAGQGPRSLCNDPSQHIFFDTEDPVKEVHQLIAVAFQEKLASF